MCFFFRVNLFLSVHILVSIFVIDRKKKSSGTIKQLIQFNQWYLYMDKIENNMRLPI